MIVFSYKTFFVKVNPQISPVIIGHTINSKSVIGKSEERSQ